MKRRSFIKKGILGLAGIGCLSSLYAWQIEPFWLEFVTVKMPLKNLPESLVGKTLMQISDIHVGNSFDYRFIIDSFNEAKELNPDIVVYTGDFVSAHSGDIEYEKLGEVLKNGVKGKSGTIGILGNHDYGRNWSQREVADRISNMLDRNGILVLRNEYEEIDGLHVIGLDDYWGLNFMPENVMDFYDSSKPFVALCHNPDVCDLDIWKNFEGWILSGHTHGGQVKPPFLPPPLLPVRNKRYDSGIFEVGFNRTLYINRALGHLYQVRFNVRPEITVFEFAKL